MRKVLILLAFCVCFSCKDNSKNESQPVIDTKETSVNQDEQPSIKSYTNENWGFSLEYPEGFQVLESELPGSTSVINIYAEGARFNPPFTIHEEPANAYIAVLPEGLGVDGPAGKQKTLADWEGDLSWLTGLNLENSRAYLLESGQPWAFFLRFEMAPKNWEKYGGVFVHFRIQNFKAECYNSKTGNSKGMKDCDPMGGDEVRYTGNIESVTKREMTEILKSFEFKSTGKPKITELIKVEKPLPNIEVTSPLQVEGKARGYWFFEANAPIEIVDKDDNILGESYIEAKGEWMTEDFIEFTGTISFKAPDDERGYLVFKRANPSDLKENDREFRIPILFPPKIKEPGIKR